jgi:hypothetical protein
VARSFTQKYGIDYSMTYSPVMDGTTFRWIIAFAVNNGYMMNQADIVTAYLYGNLDKEIYMTIPEGLVKDSILKKFKHPCVRLVRSIYGLKQAGRIWYQHFTRYLVSACGFKTVQTCPCVFVKRRGDDVVLIAIYVDDVIMIGTRHAIEVAACALKVKFKIRDFGRLDFCLGVQVTHLKDGVILHQSTYVKKILERFSMDRAHPSKSPMVVRSLNPLTDPFAPCRKDEPVLSQKYPYMEAIGALMYLANYTRPDIAFATNLLARFSQEPTKRHWFGIKQIMRYLGGTIDMGLYYRRKEPHTQGTMIGYADAGFMSDPHRGRSQTGYVFMAASAAISWRSTKQTLVATSSKSFWLYMKQVGNVYT